MKPIRFHLVFIFSCLALFCYLLLATFPRPLSSDSAPVFYPRSADGPGGYRDDKFNQQQNLSQTGVWDKGVPLWQRQQQAEKLGYEIPLE